MRKPILACYATILSVSDEIIYLQPDISKGVIWRVAANGQSLYRKSYVDTDIPAYEGQYVGVVSISDETSSSDKLEVYDANNPVFLGLIADELKEDEVSFGHGSR